MFSAGPRADATGVIVAMAAAADAADAADGIRTKSSQSASCQRD